MSSCWVSLCLWLALAPAITLASSQQHATFIQLLPGPKWHEVGARSLTLNQLEKWGAIPQVDAEYGAKTAELRTYSRDGQRIQVVVEQAPDPSAAFGLFTFYQTDKMRPVPGMQLASVGPDLALMVRGHWFVRVLRPAENPLSDASLRAFLISIGGAKLSPRSLELLPAMLPEKEMITGSEKYVLGAKAASRAVPWFPTELMDFAQGAEVHTAGYQRNGGRVDLMLIAYPTPQIARLRFNAIENQLSLNRTGRAGKWFGKQDGSFVFVVHRNAAATRIQALALLNDLTVKKSVTFDEKYQSKPVAVQMVEFFLANFLLIFFLVVMAAFAGILMVIGRRVLARRFPNAIWVQAGENSLIRLNLEGR